MAPSTNGPTASDPAVIDRVEWLAQRDLGAPVPGSDPTRASAGAAPTARSSSAGTGSAARSRTDDAGSRAGSSASGASASSGDWVRFLRDGHVPRFRAPGGVQVIEVDADGSESFASTALFGLGLPARFESSLASLPGRDGWRCYVASGGRAPAAVATFADGPIVLLAIDASAEAGRRSDARMALLHRAIEDAAAAGARTIGARVDTEADAPRKETAAGLLLAGFKAAYPCPAWVDSAMPAS